MDGTSGVVLTLYSAILSRGIAGYVDSGAVVSAYLPIVPGVCALNISLLCNVYLTLSFFVGRVRSDMDEPMGQLMGAHGYCSQVSARVTPVTEI